MNPLPVAADKCSGEGGVMSMAMGVTGLTVVLGLSAIAALIIYWVIARASS
jgi:hypothetical protein